MKNIQKILLVTATLLMSVCIGYAQDNKVDFEVQSSHALFLGKSKPIKELIKNNVTSTSKKKDYKKLKQKPTNFVNRRGQSKSISRKLEHQGPDPLRQVTNKKLGSIVEPLLNIDGIGDFGSPHDPTGDIGIDYYMQAVNVTIVGIFTKEGELVEVFDMNVLWSEFNASSAGDPIILFDEEASRWVVTEFTGPANLLIAISETSDPLGSYFAYSFSTPNFPDYPKYSIWPDAYTVTTNEEGGNVLHQYFLDRHAMLNGEENITMQRIAVMGNDTEAGFFVSTPVDWNGTLMPNSSDPIVLALNDSSWGQVEEDLVDIYTFSINFNDPDLSNVVNNKIPMTPFDSYPCSVDGFGFSCIPQPNGIGLDGIPEVIMNVPHYRNFGTHESMVFCFITDVTNGDNLSGIRWVELRKTGTTEWELYQEGTFAPDDGLDRYMCCIAIDKNGNIGLGYNVSSETEYVGVRYTGRFATDPLGSMTIDEYNAVSGSTTIQSSGRFGDYSQMSVDPVDGSTFWFTTEYGGGGTGGTKTRIVAFQLQKDSIDLAIAGIVNPISSSGLGAVESLEIVVTNAGIDSLSNFDIGFQLDNQLVENKMIQDTLAPGEARNYTFDQTIDLSILGDYEIKAYVNYSLDSNQVNDTLIQIISKLIDLDAAISASAPNSTCESEFNVELVIYNHGDIPMTQANINVYVNDQLYNTYPWTGSVVLDNPANQSISLADLAIGNNIINITISDPNDTSDTNSSNDSTEFSINIIDNTGSILLNILTDEYPEETTYQIVNIESGNLVAKGGPFDSQFTLESISHCLSIDSCYEITVYDQYSDGICCDYGEGTIDILGYDGATLISIDGEFGSETVNRFCPGLSCMISGEITTTPASSSSSLDGTILINAANGIAPFLYSIDGGETYSKSNIFDNLQTGEYHVVILDAKSICQYEEIVFVDISSSIQNTLLDELKITLSPNPNNGYFKLILDHVKTDANFIFVQILNAQGQLVQERRLGKYNDTFETTISLVAYPSGTYFIKYLDKAIPTLTKVIKE